MTGSSHEWKRIEQDWKETFEELSWRELISAIAQGALAAWRAGLISAHQLRAIDATLFDAERVRLQRVLTHDSREDVSF